MHNGQSAEIAVVGNEGIIGVSLFMGGESTSSSARVQSAGGDFRLTPPLMKEEFNRGGPVLHLLLRYTQAQMTQMVQTAACNKHHSLDQQLCRWLLLSIDRLQGTEMLMTEELIANMLGVRSKKAVAGALKLQNASLIDYTRGRIRALDRAGLEERTCECYEVVRKESAWGCAWFPANVKFNPHTREYPDFCVLSHTLPKEREYGDQERDIG